MSFTSNINDLVGSAISAVRDIANDLPPTHSAFQPVITWVVAIVAAIIAALEVILRAVDSKADLLHDEISLVETHIANQAREAVHAAVLAHPQLPPSTAAATASSSTTQQRPAAPRRSKCTKCHARGHDATQCRTANPSAMRKRVARNNRTAKLARSKPIIEPQVIPIPPPSPYHPMTHYNPIPVAMHSMEYAAIAADSSELRRRAAQSARDKRRRKKDAAA